MSQYYYMVAGLPDISSEDAKLSLGYVEYLEALMTALSDKDAALLRYFRMAYDNQSLMAWLHDKTAELHPLASVTPELLNEQMQLLEFDDQPPLRGVPAYFPTFMREWRDGIPAGTEENRLSALFYDCVKACPNAFVREWFAFEQNLNNAQVALSCRKYGIELAGQIVGDNEVAQSLRSSSLRDFGIGNIFPQMESLMHLNNETDLIEKEKHVDELVWAFLDDQCTFHYFSVEPLLAYLIKLQRIERWMKLDPKTGEAKFRALVYSMKEGVEIPDTTKN